MAAFESLYQNGTQLVTSFLSTASAQQASLYKTIDPSTLGFLERLWYSWYSLPVFKGDPVLATGLMSFFLHEVRGNMSRVTIAEELTSVATSLQLVYFGRCLPWIAVDAMPYFRRWKLQPVSQLSRSKSSPSADFDLTVQNKIPTAAQQWACTKAVLLVHFTVELPQIYAFYPIAASVGMKTFHLSFPSYAEMAYQLAIFFVIEDAWHVSWVTVVWRSLS